MCIYCGIRLSGINRHRRQQFGDLTLKLFETTPETGETEAAEFEADWRGFRTVSTTDGGLADAGAWQFELKAEDDWETSQAYMSRVVALKVGDRRWKTKKVEKPIGHTLFWRFKATIQDKG